MKITITKDKYQHTYIQEKTENKYSLVYLHAHLYMPEQDNYMYASGLMY